MYKTLLKIFSLLLCLGLLAPILEKSIHSWQHRNDIHCNTSGKHFHEQEHDCNVCDYDMPVQDVQSVVCDLTIYSQSVPCQNTYQASITSYNIFFSTSRAPPIIV